MQVCASPRTNGIYTRWPLHTFWKWGGFPCPKMRLRPEIPLGKLCALTPVGGANCTSPGTLPQQFSLQLQFLAPLMEEEKEIYRRGWRLTYSKASKSVPRRHRQHRFTDGPGVQVCIQQMGIFKRFGRLRPSIFRWLFSLHYK